MNLNLNLFPKNFLWGAATSAFQSEGAWNADGKGESNWDRWCHTSGKIKDGGNADIACDFYHRYPEDIEIMKQLGLTAFRFSIAWTRVQPDGRGVVNPKGIEFYDKLIDLFLNAGITPFVCLCHYDIPQVLEDKGGWVNREFTDWFADYAYIMAQKYGDRVKNWFTINEPICISEGHYSMTLEPPGLGAPQAGATVSHHLLLGHGKALRAIKSLGNHKVGIICNLYPIHPFNNSKQTNYEDSGHRRSIIGDGCGEESTNYEDQVQAVRLADGYINRWWLDPIYKGTYPQDIWRHKDFLPQIQDGDLEIISTKPDYLGVNYYHRMVVKPLRSKNKLSFQIVDAKELGTPYSEMGWEIYPEGLYEIVKTVASEYTNEIYITENGVSYADKISSDGFVHDAKRIDYLQQHLQQVEKCIRNGVNIKGYFAWTLMDNFEWELGWTQKFGLVYLDRKTLNRVIKDSGIWYRNLILKHKTKE
ncbi:MAG: family 1 glycosylhydrolase [Phycisphaerae bacterium]|jgi:beta-glucosidase